jgi:hypothetical protein
MFLAEKTVKNYVSSLLRAGWPWRRGRARAHGEGGCEGGGP